MSGEVVAWVNGKGLACLQEVRSGSLFATSSASDLDGQDTALVLATDYADMRAAFDSCNRLSILRWRVILELQAKLDAVTKDAESWREWKAAQARVEEEMPEGYAITMHCSPGDWDIDLVDPSNKRIEIHDYDDVTNFFNRAIDAALTDQGRAGDGRGG